MFMKSVKTRYIEYLDSKIGVKKYNKFKRILYGNPDSLVLELFDRIYPKFKERKEIRILDVGGGDGKRLRHIIDLFGKKGISVCAELIEPSKTFTDNLKNDLKKKKYKINIFRSKLEDFKAEGKYDLILFIHSIYTFQDSGYLKKAKRMAAKNSSILIITNDRKSFLADLKKMTDQDFHSSRREIRDVENDLEREQLSFRKFRFNTVYGGIVKDGKLTKDGNLLLEWIALRNLRLIDEELKSQAVKAANKYSKNNIITDKEVLLMISNERSIAKK
jgi:SAM-dependent methyltransferase